MSNTTNTIRLFGTVVDAPWTRWPTGGRPTQLRFWLAVDGGLLLCVIECPDYLPWRPVEAQLSQRPSVVMDAILIPAERIPTESSPGVMFALAGELIIAGEAINPPAKPSRPHGKMAAAGDGGLF